MHYKTIDPARALNDLYARIAPGFHFRRIDIRLCIGKDLPPLFMPLEVLNKVMEGLIKNAVENTPDQGRIDIDLAARDNGIRFSVHDYGVGIEPDDQKRIFEGFFSTQETLLYSTKSPYAFNAGGKGADLLRMKLFADCLGFTIGVTSKRCTFLSRNRDEVCPGDILKCRFCRDQAGCLNSGESVFSLFFPDKKNKKSL
jgi:light-regulated signal transduction histidine kinase (bacteriophytochrome)